MLCYVIVNYQRYSNFISKSNYIRIFLLFDIKSHLFTLTGVSPGC